MPFFKRYKHLLAIIAVFVLLAVVVLSINSGVFRDKTVGGRGVSYAVAFTERVIQRNIHTDADGVKGLLAGDEEMQVHILTGRYAGNKLQASAILTTEMQVAPKAGQLVVVSIDVGAGNTASVLVDDAFRLPVWAGAVLVLILFLLLIGKRKGGLSLAALAFNLICVMGVFIPLVFQGHNPLVCAAVVQLTVAGVTFWMMDGLHPKSLAAFTGTMAGTFLAGGFAILCGWLTDLNGFAMSGADSLVVIAQSTQLQVRHLLLASVLMASFGAVMDIAMSIAAAIGELHLNSPQLPGRQLFLAGMRIGRDMMGTMVNTLLLAYAGASITTILLLYSYLVPVGQAANGKVLQFSSTASQVPLWTLLNNGLVGTELMEGITGAVAIVLTVPLVSAVSAKLMPLYNHGSGEESQP